MAHTTMTASRRNGDDASTTDPHPLAAHFAKFAQSTAQWTGHPATFLSAVAIVIVWIVTGPLFGYSDTWQLVINTGTTIVTFLMVFLIQNTQNRDMMSMQLKLSELVLAMKGAENKFASIEDLSDDELKKLHDECRARTELTTAHIEKRRTAISHDKAQPVKTQPGKTQSVKTQSTKAHVVKAAAAKRSADSTKAS
jgi:low affinity Fe/Cu permease